LAQGVAQIQFKFSLLPAELFVLSSQGVDVRTDVPQSSPEIDHRNGENRNRAEESDHEPEDGGQSLLDCSDRECRVEGDMRSRFVLVLLIVGAVVIAAHAMQSGGCEPHGNVRFICGLISPEDLVAVPRSEWVVVSGYTAGAVHLVSTRDYKSMQVYPAATTRERLDKATYPTCPGPMDPNEKQKFSAHGLAVREGAKGLHTVYLVHHGFREAIEVFEVDVRQSTPAFTWIGCVVAPASVLLNSVSPLPEGGFVATNPNRKGAAPSPAGDTGEVWEWNTKDGWKIVTGSESQGPNGIEVSKDGRTLYVNLWPARQIMRLSRGQTPVQKTVVDVAFHPDNIHWQSDGTLFAAGHGGPSIQRISQCFRQVCPDTTSNVARIDPQTMKVQQLITYPSNERFTSSTAALLVGKEIWIGTITNDRVARYPLP
jgi:hypothetical protein